MTMDYSMGIRVGFDEDFAFSTAGSFSAASTTSSLRDPFTPTSGRSTPGFQPNIMDHESVNCATSGAFDLAPLESAFGSYYPQEPKADITSFLDCDSYAATPERKNSMPPTTMDFGYHTSMSGSSVPQDLHGDSASSLPANQQHHFPEHFTPSPLNFPTPSYTLDSNCDVPSTWAWAGESPLALFEKRNSPMLASPVRLAPPRGRGSMTPSLPLSQGRRRLRGDDVQQRSSVLHQVQRGRAGKKDKKQREHEGDIQVVASGHYRCHYEECMKAHKRPFKRQEHLKRHIHTVHLPAQWLHCPFCERKFNGRRDNWRSHIELHTKKDSRSSSRTTYHPDAQAFHDAEMKKTKQRNSQQAKRKDGARDESEDC
ncbi:hypothetical protein F4778DRAFT_263962 [Xylariomycetidae sp. FL2044]|nr:hypothetical protein F4778DRAFT_263962 [Xylariomycetidae sp. FL2044]